MLKGDVLLSCCMISGQIYILYIGHQLSIPLGIFYQQKILKNYCVAFCLVLEKLLIRELYCSFDSEDNNPARSSRHYQIKLSFSVEKYKKQLKLIWLSETSKILIPGTQHLSLFPPIPAQYLGISLIMQVSQKLTNNFLFCLCQLASSLLLANNQNGQWSNVQIGIFQTIHVQFMQHI